MMINYLFLFYFHDVGLFLMVAKYNVMSDMEIGMVFSFSILLIIYLKICGNGPYILFRDIHL